MEIVEKEALSVIGLPIRARWQELWVEMPKAWREFIARHSEIEYRQGGTFLDISLDETGDEYLQLICTRVSRVSRVPKDMRAIEIPAQPYIYHRHIGPVAGIAESFGEMYAWAREYGHSASEFRVDAGYTIEGNEPEHDLYVGLNPIQQWRNMN